MLFYNILLIIILISLFLSTKIKKERYNKYLQVFIFIFLFSISAFRYYVGTDFGGYRGVYKAVIVGKYKNYGFERGYDLLMYITKIFSENYQAIFVITSLIIVGLIFLSIKRNSSNFYLSIFLFVSMYFYFNSFNVVRQFIAISLICYSLKYVEEKKPINFILLILLATTFHKTSIITLLLYFIKDFKVSKKTYIIGGLLTVAIIPLVPIMIEIFVNIFPKYLLYLTFPKSSGLSATGIIILAIFILSIVVKEELVRKNSMNNLYINGIYLAFLTQMLASTNIQFIRISMYFYILSIFLIPDIISIIKEKNIFGIKISKYATIGTILFFMVWCNYLLYSNVGEVVPYTICF